MTTSLRILLVLFGIAYSGQAWASVDCLEMHAQAQANQVRRLQELLDQGGNVACRDPEDNDATALMKAAGAGSVEATRMLLQRGADINARDGSGWTALHRARAAHAALVRAGTMHAGNVARLETVIELLNTANAAE